MCKQKGVEFSGTVRYTMSKNVNQEFFYSAKVIFNYKGHKQADEAERIREHCFVPCLSDLQNNKVQTIKNCLEKLFIRTTRDHYMYLTLE